MFGHNRNTALGLVLVVAAASACDTGTGPERGTPFDAQAALEDHEALEIILQSDVMASFRAMGAGISLIGMAPGIDLAVKAADFLRAPADPDEAGSLARELLRAAAGMGPGPFANPIISTFRRGKTFVYDAGLGRYVLDHELAGAPPTGVRFLLYEPGPDGKPDPSAQIGHADLIDEGDDSEEEIALLLIVMKGETPVLEYRTTLDVVHRGGVITVNGFLQGEEDRLTFDIRVAGSAGPAQNTVDISFRTELESRDFLIEGTVQGVASDSGEGGEVDLLVRHGEDSFQVDVTGTESSIEGTFHLNGNLFATVSGHPDEPTITGASGSPPTFVEMLVLRQMLDSAEDVFDLFEGLLDPIDELVILAIIL